MATEIGAIKARLELDIRQYREGIERAKRDLADVSDGAKKASGNFGGLADAAEKVAEKQAQIGRLATVLDNLNARIEAQRKKLAELKRSYESAFDDTRKSRLQEQIVNTEASLLRLTKASDDTAKKIWELEDSLDGASEKFEIFGESAKSSVTKLGVAYGALTAAMAAVITKSVETAATFEQSMAKVRAVSGATASEFQRLQDQAIELGATTVFTASQAADAQSYLAMAGFETNEIMAAMPGVLNLAAAGQMDLARTADIASNILTGFQLSADEAGRVVDVMAKAMVRSNTNIEQLGYAMKYAAPIAASTGVSIEETAAAIGKLSDAGIQGEMAGTQLRAILLRLIKPVGDAKDVMDQLGIKTQDAAGNILPFTSILRQVETAFAGLTQSAQAEAAAFIAGTEAASGFLTLVNTGADSIESFASELRNAGGTAEQIAATQMDTLNGAIDEMKSALEGVGITVGNDFKPAIRAAVEEITRMLLGINEMDAGSRAFLVTLPLVSAGLGTLATAIYGIVVALRALQSAGIAANAALGWISALSLVVGGVAAAFVSYKASVEEAAEAQRQFNELIEKPALERTADDVRTLQAEMDELNRLLEQRAELERKLSEIPMAARASQEMAQEIRNLEQALDDTDKALKRFGIDTPEKAPEVLARLNDEINESIPALAELERQEMATVAAKVKHIDRVVELRRQYEDLTSSEQKSEEQKAQLKNVVEELVREYPSLIAQLDEENSWHIVNKGALDDIIQAEKDSVAVASQASRQRLESYKKETEAKLKMARMQIEALNAAQGVNFTETKIGKRLPSELSQFIEIAGDYVLGGLSATLRDKANGYLSEINQLERDLQNITIGAFDQFNEGGAKNSYGTGTLDLDKKKPKKERTKREKTAAELQQEAYRASLAYIDYMRNVGKMSEEQEIAALERLLKRYQKNTEIRRDAEVRIYRIREQLEADAEKRAEEARKKAEKDAKDAAKKAEEAARARFDASAEWIDAQERKMTEAYASEREIAQMQLEAWTRVRNRYEKDSEYYKRADIEMYNARMRLRKLDEQAAKEAADAEKKAADERAKLAKEATSALVKEIDKQRKAELDALNQRRKAIEDFYAEQNETIDEGERLRERQKLEEEAQKYRYATSQRGQEQYLELMEKIRQMDIEDQKRNLAKERDEKLEALDRQKNDIETWYSDIRETIEAFSGDFISIYKLTEDERFNAFVTTNEKIKAELERFKAEYAAIYGISPTTTSPNGGQSSQHASIIAQMQANSAAWKSASAAERARLEAENQRLGSSLGATLDRKTGRWMLGGLPLYHTGGRVGEFNFRTGDRLMPDEIAAILRRDEYVFTPQQLESLIGARMSGPAVNVHIEKVMEVNDATFEDSIDLRALGRDAGDTAVAVIRTQFTGGGGR